MGDTTTGQPAILLVEDEHLIALTQRAMLAKGGYAVTHAVDGLGAVAAATGGSFAAVLMDINLGRGMDGITAAEHILAHQDVPIIFLTSHSEDEMLARAARVPSYGYVMKTAGSAVLNFNLVNALRIHRAKTQAEHAGTLYRELFDASPDGIVLTDADGRFVELNDRFLEITGYRREDLVGRNFRDITPDRWRSFEDEQIAAQVATRGYTDRYHKEYIGAEGDVIPVDIHVFGTLRDGTMDSMWGVVRDRR